MEAGVAIQARADVTDLLGQHSLDVSSLLVRGNAVDHGVHVQSFADVGGFHQFTGHAEQVGSQGSRNAAVHEFLQQSCSFQQSRHGFVRCASEGGGHQRGQIAGVSLRVSVWRTDHRHWAAQWQSPGLVLVRRVQQLAALALVQVVAVSLQRVAEDHSSSELGHQRSNLGVCQSQLNAVSVESLFDLDGVAVDNQTAFFDVDSASHVDLELQDQVFSDHVGQFDQVGVVSALLGLVHNQRMRVEVQSVTLVVFLGLSQEVGSSQVRDVVRQHVSADLDVHVLQVDRTIQTVSTVHDASGQQRVSLRQTDDVHLNADLQRSGVDGFAFENHSGGRHQSRINEVGQRSGAHHRHHAGHFVLQDRGVDQGLDDVLAVEASQRAVHVALDVVVHLDQAQRNSHAHVVVGHDVRWVESFAEVVLLGSQEVVGNGVDHGVTVVGLIVGFHCWQAVGESISHHCAADHALGAFNGFHRQAATCEGAQISRSDRSGNHGRLLLGRNAFDAQASHHGSSALFHGLQGGVQLADHAVIHGLQAQIAGDFNQRRGALDIVQNCADCRQNFASVGIVFLTTGLCRKQIGHV